MAGLIGGQGQSGGGDVLFGGVVSNLGMKMSRDEVNPDQQAGWLASGIGGHCRLSIC